MSTTLTFRLSDETAAAFAAKFSGRGERSLVLQQMVERLVAPSGQQAKQSRSVSKDHEKDPLSYRPDGKSRSFKEKETVRFSVRLTPNQFLKLEGESLKVGMKTSPYVRAVVDAHLKRVAELSPGEREDLASAASQLRKVGVNLNQLTTVCRSANTQGKKFPVDGGEISAVKEKVNHLLDRFNELMRSRDSYWKGKVDRNG